MAGMSSVPRSLSEAVLPITIIPGSNPPVFRWRQAVSTPVGRQWVEHEGSLPPTVEGAVAMLVGIAKQLLYDNAVLQGRVADLEGKLAAHEVAAVAPPAPATPTTTKRGK